VLLFLSNLLICTILVIIAHKLTYRIVIICMCEVGINAIRELLKCGSVAELIAAVLLFYLSLEYQFRPLGCVRNK